MRALLLLGGLGTRLRPLTLERPKPLLPILNRPFLAYQIDLLKRFGVREVILALGHQSAHFRRKLGDGRAWGVRFIYSVEKEPLGTGGAIRLARPHLTEQCIVVGIDNGGADRLNEYSPWVNAQYGGGQGDEYIEFLVSTLKPYIDANYRTLPGRNTTGIMGSSMGGLISMYGFSERQDIFAKAGMFSPARPNVRCSVSRCPTCPFSVMATEKAKARKRKSCRPALRRCGRSVMANGSLPFPKAAPGKRHDHHS